MDRSAKKSVSVEWIQLAQDTNLWRALVNTAMNLRVLAPHTWLVKLVSYFPRITYFFSTIPY
jgi:hypothetical protein